MVLSVSFKLDSDIATNCGKHVPLDDDQVDLLCEKPNTTEILA